MNFYGLPESIQEHLNFLFSPDSPNSISHKLPKEISERMMELLSGEPALCSLLQDEDELLIELNKNHRYQPTVNDYRVRHLFWVEIENSFLDGREIVLNNIHSLVCDKKTFQTMFLKQAKRVAFLLCRPMGYQESIKETLLHGLKHLRRILDMNEYDEKGRLDVRLLNLKAKIVAMMDMRINGAPTQNIKQLNLNVDAGSKSLPHDVRALVQSGDMKTLQQRIYEIEREIKKESGEREAVPLLVEAADE